MGTLKRSAFSLLCTAVESKGLTIGLTRDPDTIEIGYGGDVYESEPVYAGDLDAAVHRLVPRLEALKQ